MSRPARRTIRLGSVVALLLAFTAAAPRADVTDLPTPHGPDWKDAVPKRVLALEHDPTLTDVENGEVLRQTVRSLVAGDRLEIGTGTWSIKKYFNASLQGTETDPIWIVAAPGARPVLTRPDPYQNIINLGSLKEGHTEYVAIRGLELTGGSMGIRMECCSQVWIDQNLIHHTSQAGIVANTYNVGYLRITRNEIHHTDGTGEGMYLGANNAASVMKYSVIAQNWVHHTGGYQADGIEVKQGSYGNLIVGNVIHDTKYPCLIVYGTGGKEPNTIEGNVLFRAVDNVLQVQGEALVRNNLIMSGLNGFHSHDHQGLTRDLVFVNNTIVNERRGANLTSWANRPGMVFANNAVYSETKEAVVWGSASAAGVIVAGNVRFGSIIGPKAGFTDGAGLADFEKVAWDGSKRRALPADGSVLLTAGSPAFAPPLDLHNKVRQNPNAVGAVDQLSYGWHYGAGLAGQGGVEPLVEVNSARDLGNAAFAVELSRGRPLRTALLAIGFQPLESPVAGGTLLNDAALLFLATTDATGSAARSIPVPADPYLTDQVFFAQWSVQDDDAPGGWALTDGLRLVVEVP